jgi:hypothetical protein
MARRKRTKKLRPLLGLEGLTLNVLGGQDPKGHGNRAPTISSPLAMHPSTRHLRISDRLHSHLGAHGSLQSTAMFMSKADRRSLFTQR